MKYPFRFYGREPADWTPSPYGFLYDVQFEGRLSESDKQGVREIAEKVFSEGPAALGAVWYWADGRFLVFSLKERFVDSARMVFTQAGEFFSSLHQAMRLRDVVFCNGVGARSGRWDSWTQQQSQEPDAGPARPETDWAPLLKRAPTEALRWETFVSPPPAQSLEVRQAPPAMPAPMPGLSAGAPLSSQSAPLAPFAEPKRAAPPSPLREEEAPKPSRSLFGRLIDKGKELLRDTESVHSAQPSEEEEPAPGAYAEAAAPPPMAPRAEAPRLAAPVAPRPAAPLSPGAPRPFTDSLRDELVPAFKDPMAAPMPPAAPPPSGPILPEGLWGYPIPEGLPERFSDEIRKMGWAKIVGAFPGEELIPIEGQSVPIGWLRKNGKNAAIVCLDGFGIPQKIEVLEGYHGEHLVLDPDGLFGVYHLGSAIYSVDLTQCKTRWRTTLHANNGPIHAVSWVVDDLWAFRCTTQLMLFDLSEEDSLYVGTQQPNGELMGSFRNGTIFAVKDGYSVLLIGVCDWQLQDLVRIELNGWAPVIASDALYLQKSGLTYKVEGIDTRYEAWAAPLRTLAESNRVRRFNPALVEGASTYWRWVSPEVMPKDFIKERLEELKKKHGPWIWVEVHEGGDTTMVTSQGGQVSSRSAAFRLCPTTGEERALTCKEALEIGVTVFSTTPARDFLFFVGGATFHIYRIDLATEKTALCSVPGFSTRSGLLYDIIGLDQKNAFSVWNNTLDWHTERSDGWGISGSVRVDMPRGNSFERRSGRFALMQQSKERLILFMLSAEGPKRLTAYTDAVKKVSFREGRLFAQMIDGQWFELEGIDSLPTKE